jgi:hypothetical protein
VCIRAYGTPPQRATTHSDYMSGDIPLQPTDVFVLQSVGTTEPTPPAIVDEEELPPPPPTAGEEEQARTTKRATVKITAATAVANSDETAVVGGSPSATTASQSTKEATNKRKSKRLTAQTDAVQPLAAGTSGAPTSSAATTATAGSAPTQPAPVANKEPLVLGNANAAPGVAHAANGMTGGASGEKCERCGKTSGVHETIDVAGVHAQLCAECVVLAKKNQLLLKLESVRQPTYASERLTRVQAYVMEKKIEFEEEPRDVKRLVLDNLLFFLLGGLGAYLMYISNHDDVTLLSLFGGTFFGAGFTPLIVNGWTVVVGPHAKGKLKLDLLRTGVAGLWMLFGLVLLGFGNGLPGLNIFVAATIGQNCIGFCVLFIIMKLFFIPEVSAWWWWWCAALAAHCTHRIARSV